MIKARERDEPTSCWNKAHDYEPVFVLLGRDASAPHAIRAWADHRVLIGRNDLGDAQVQEALALASEIERHQIEEARR